MGSPPSDATGLCYDDRVTASSIPEPPVTGRVTARQAVKRTMRLPTAHRFRLAWRLASSPRVPLRARLPLLALIAYLAMPLDIVPDFIPVLGQLDDVLVAGIAVWWFLRACPPAMALAEIERLEATPLGPMGKLLPWLLMLLGGSVCLLAVLWLLAR
jgi:uncharacterized membrane protein YkvA (DUF1232 family)